MPPRYFTIEEANSLLPAISNLLGQLLEKRAKVVKASRQMKGVVGNNSDVGGAEASELVQEFMAIEQLIDAVRDYGCEIKDLNGGLIDFLARRKGREVYLCWRYGEPQEIRYYHELHTGFRGRREVDPDDFLPEQE